ncbi:hypothetical protein U9M48_018153 [Paspalum notatum var. saurae]|uniref:Uncharacterized protein n=1 Tax=Paspalum notatum var. saurae TaxID=547442 RepID=A0AAQ3WPV2_PASNO
MKVKKKLDGEITGSGEQMGRARASGGGGARRRHRSARSGGTSRRSHPPRRGLLAASPCSASAPTGVYIRRNHPPRCRAAGAGEAQADASAGAMTSCSWSTTTAMAVAMAARGGVGLGLGSRRRRRRTEEDSWTRRGSWEATCRRSYSRGWSPESGDVTTGIYKGKRKPLCLHLGVGWGGVQGLQLIVYCQTVNPRDFGSSDLETNLRSP